MSAATLSTFGPDYFDAIRAREPGVAVAWVLAFAVHGLLAAFLFYGLRWQSGATEVIEAQLMQLPPMSAPLAVAVERTAPPVKVKEPEPEPIVQKPDIEVKAPEPLKAAPKPEPKPTPPKVIAKAEPKAPPKRDEIQDALAKELLRDPIKDAIAKEERAGVANAAGKEATQRGQAEWADKIRAKVRGRMRDYADAPSNYSAAFQLEILPSYDVMSTRLVRSSGNSEFDQDAERAIRAASPLPRPKDEASYTRTLTLNFRARN